MNSMKQQPNNGNGHSLSWKYFCCNDIHLLPHTHSFRRACPGLIHDPCSGSPLRELETTSGREANPGEIFPDHLPKLFWQVSLPQQSSENLSSWATWYLKSQNWNWYMSQGLNYFEDKWMDYLRWPLFNAFTYDSFLSVSVLWSSLISDSFKELLHSQKVL